MREDEHKDLESSPAVQDTDVMVYRAEDINELPDNLASLLNRGNIAADRDDLNDLSQEILEGIKDDEQSMDDYLKKYGRAIRLARMMDDEGDKTFPFQGASRVMMPYVLEAAMEFWARNVPSLIERKDICQIEVFGRHSEEKQARADRVAEFTNYDLRSGIKGWRENQSKAMLSLPISGTVFKKTWYSPTEEKRKSQLIHADQLICDHSRQSFYDCPRKSYTYEMGKNGVVSAIRSGQFLEHDYDENGTSFKYIESHCTLDLDDDGYAEPYIVTICDSTQEIVSIVPRFQFEDVTVTEKREVVEICGEEFFSITTFIPDPAGSWLGLGWGILLGDLFESINTNIRQLIDAGTLQNVSANSGFISTGGVGAGVKRARKGRYQLQMGQFTAIETGGNTPIAQSIWQPNAQGPSPTLFQLMQALREDAKSLVTISQNVEGNPNEAAELYLARLSQSLKLPQAIQTNVYNGVTKELERLYEIYTRYLDSEEYSDVLNDPDANYFEDFAEDSVDIKPTADPTQGSQEEQIAKAQLILGEAKTNPVHDLRAAYINYYEALGIANFEKYLPPPQPGQPDPLAVMQAQAQADMGQAEKMKGIADMIGAQADMMEAEAKMIKLQSEIEKIESETMKNLAEVDRKEMQSRLDALKAFRESVRGNFEDARKLFETYTRASETVAAQPRMEGNTGGVSTAPRSPGGGGGGMAGL